MMDMTSQIAVVRDIPYTGSHSQLHAFDLYIPSVSYAPNSLDPHQNGKNGSLPSESPPPLICFVHGGAWRSEDKSEHAELAQRLAAFTSFPVAVPNYRLTKPETPIKHPAHAEDVLRFLHFLLDWEGPSDYVRMPYDPKKLYLIGHSCSAHMLASVYLFPTLPTTFPGFENLEPSKQLLEATQGIAFSEGIYDIDLLIDSFPNYKSWFIANTFGDLESYAPFNTAAYSLRLGAGHVHWLIMHSRKDTLVDLKQSEKFREHLKKVTGIVENAGGGEQVKWDDTLEEDHDEVLETEGYAKKVADFVLEHHARK